MKEIKCKYRDTYDWGTTCDGLHISPNGREWNIPNCEGFLKAGECPIWWRRWYHRLRNWYLKLRYGRTVNVVLDEVVIYDPRLE